MSPMIFLLFAGTLHASPVDYEDMENLLPTEPQTANDTLAVIVQDPVVQDAVQNAIGDGSLQGLVVKKKTLIMPATEPTKVVSQREQILAVPTTYLEDVRRNITEAAAETQSPVEGNDEDGDASSANHDGGMSQRADLYETTTEIPVATRGSTFPIDNVRVPQEVPYPSQEEEALPVHPSISMPVMAFLDPAKISDKIDDAPIAATGNPENRSKNRRDQTQRDNVQDYVDGNTWSVAVDDWPRASHPPQIRASSSPVEPDTTGETRQRKTTALNPERSLLLAMPRIDVATPLFWTADVDDNYPRDPHDIVVAADIVFRPLFRYRQEAQRKSSYRRPAYRRYNSYDSYPRRNYRYGSRYSSDYYY